MLSKLELRFLNLNERAQYVSDYGQYVSSRREGAHKINVYLVGSYYVEIIYHAGSNQVIDVIPLDTFQKH